MSVEQNFDDNFRIAQKVSEIYHQRILPTLDIEQIKGKIVVVDGGSGDYVIADNVREAQEMAAQKFPQTQVLYVHTGFEHRKDMKRYGYRRVIRKENNLC